MLVEIMYVGIKHLTCFAGCTAAAHLYGVPTSKMCEGQTQTGSENGIAY